MPRPSRFASKDEKDAYYREYQRAYREANKEKLALAQHTRYVEQRDDRLAKHRVYYQQRAEIYKERARQYRLAHPKETKAYWRERKTGCGPELYAKLLAEQGGVCAICGGTDSRELCADHDHSTGMVRGLLCRNCNLGIGHLRHDVAILRLAIGYLQDGVRAEGERV